MDSNIFTFEHLRVQHEVVGSLEYLNVSVHCPQNLTRIVPDLMRLAKISRLPIYLLDGDERYAVWNLCDYHQTTFIPNDRVYEGVLTEYTPPVGADHIYQTNDGHFIVIIDGGLVLIKVYSNRTQSAICVSKIESTMKLLPAVYDRVITLLHLALYMQYYEDILVVDGKRIIMDAEARDAHIQKLKDQLDRR